MRAFLIKKALEERIINSVNSNRYINEEILKNIFSLRIINLENAEVNMQKIPGGNKSKLFGWRFRRDIFRN